MTQLVLNGSYLVCRVQNSDHFDWLLRFGKEFFFFQRHHSSCSLSSEAKAELCSYKRCFLLLKSYICMLQVKFAIWFRPFTIYIYHLYFFAGMLPSITGRWTSILLVPFPAN